jgi:hypothetical protein
MQVVICCVTDEGRTRKSKISFLLMAAATSERCSVRRLFSSAWAQLRRVISRMNISHACGSRRSCQVAAAAAAAAAAGQCKLAGGDKQAGKLADTLLAQCAPKWQPFSEEACNACS